MKIPVEIMKLSREKRMTKIKTGTLIQIDKNTNSSIKNPFSLAPIDRMGVVVLESGYIEEVPLYLLKVQRGYNETVR